MAGVCDVPVISTVCDKVGEGAASLISAPFDWLAQAVGKAAAWMFKGVWQLFDSTTLVDISGDGYIHVYNVVFGIAVFITFAFFCLQLIAGLIRREPGALARAATGMAKSILGAFILVTITTILLEIVDQLCTGIIQATGTTLEEMGGKIGALVAGLVTLQLAAPGAAAIIVIFLSFLAISAACIVWFSLLVRKALILILIVLGPIALAGAGWDVTKGWFAKWASFVIALIFSKFVVVLIFLVAITQVNAPIDGDLASIADPVAGIVLMCMAGFAPYMCYKLLAFAGADMYHLTSTEQEAKQSMNRPVPVPHLPKPDSAKPVLDGAGDKGGGGGQGPSGDSGGPSPAGTGPAPAAKSPGAEKPDAGNGSAPEASGAKSGSAEAGKSAGAGAKAGAGTAGSAGAGTGAGAGSAGAGAGGAAGAGAAAGPIGVGIAAGAAVAKGAAQAGPKAGAAVGQAADAQASGASEGAAAPPDARPQQPTPSAPAQPASAKPPKAEPTTPPSQSPPAPPKH